MLREKLGIDKPLSFPYNAHNLDKSEKEACNLVAKASGEGRASPIGTILGFLRTHFLYRILDSKKTSRF